MASFASFAPSAAQSFYSLSDEAQALPPSHFIHFHGEVDATKKYEWKTLRNLVTWLHKQVTDLEQEGVFIKSTDVAMFQDSIQANPEGLSTTIEWNTGKLQWLTKIHVGKWTAVVKKYCQSPMVLTSRTDSRCEEFAEVDNLKGWLTCQAKEIMRTNPDYGWGDLENLEALIRRNPQGFRTKLEWDRGRWELMIQEDPDEPDTWKTVSVLEEVSTVSTFDDAWARRKDLIPLGGSVSSGDGQLEGARYPANQPAISGGSQVVPVAHPSQPVQHSSWPATQPSCGSVSPSANRPVYQNSAKPGSHW